MTAPMTVKAVKDIIRQSVDEELADLIEARLREMAPPPSWAAQILSQQREQSAKPAPQKGQTFARMLQLAPLAKGDPERAVAIAKKKWPDDHEDVIKALSAGDAAAGGFIVPPSYATDIIELLRAQSVVRSMSPLLYPMPNGSADVPKLTGGATSNYVAETQNAPTSQETFGMLKLTYKKLITMVIVSNDLLRYSSPAADSIVRDDAVAAMALREDLAFIRGDGTSDTPRGLRYWAPAANVLAVNATVNLANVISDLGKIELQLRNANVRMLRPGWLMAPRTETFLKTRTDANSNLAFFVQQMMTSRQLMGFPYALTTQIPINLAVTNTNESEIYLVDFADAVIGEAQRLIIDASDTAAYYDSTLAAVQAAFSRDVTAIRVISEHDFGMRHDESVALYKDVDWIP